MKKLTLKQIFCWKHQKASKITPEYDELDDENTTKSVLFKEKMNVFEERRTKHY